MKILPSLILHGTFAWLALSFIPQYGTLVSGLFDQVSNGLEAVHVQSRT